MKCNLTLCIGREQFLLLVYVEGFKIAIVLKKNVLYICFVDLVKVFIRALRKVM